MNWILLNHNTLFGTRNSSPLNDAITVFLRLYRILQLNSFLPSFCFVAKVRNKDENGRNSVTISSIILFLGFSVYFYFLYFDFCAQSSNVMLGIWSKCSGCPDLAAP